MPVSSGRMTGLPFTIEVLREWQSLGFVQIIEPASDPFGDRGNSTSIRSFALKDEIPQNANVAHSIQQTFHHFIQNYLPKDW